MAGERMQMRAQHVFSGTETEDAFDFELALGRWRILEQRAIELEVLKEQCLQIEAPAITHAELIKASQDIEREQYEILKDVSSCEARNLDDVKVKMELWKTIMCPTDEDEALLQPTDHIVMSVYADLLEGRFSSSLR